MKIKYRVYEIDNDNQDLSTRLDTIKRFRYNLEWDFDTEYEAIKHIEIYSSGELFIQKIYITN